MSQTAKCEDCGQTVRRMCRENEYPEMCDACYWMTKYSDLLAKVESVGGVSTPLDPETQHYREAVASLRSSLQRAYEVRDAVVAAYKGRAYVLERLECHTCEHRMRKPYFGYCKGCTRHNSRWKLDSFSFS